MKKNVKVAYESIKQNIISCKYSPGQFVSEKDIVAYLNISRTPVREAINILKGEGLLDIIPSKGIQISHLSAENIEEIYDLRMVIEPLLVKEAIKNLSQKDFEYLTELNERLISVVTKKNVSEIFQIGRDIHLHIARISNNEVLFYIIKLLRNESHRGNVFYLQKLFDNENSIENDGILNTILDRHGKLLKSLMEKDEEAAIGFIKDELRYAKKIFRIAGR